MVDQDWQPPHGTYVFDGHRSRMAYGLNKLGMSLKTPENREAFRDDERGYCARYGLSEEQTDAVLARDWIRLIRLGGNIYYIFKLAAIGGETMQHIGAQQNGMTLEQFRAKLNSHREA